MSLSLSFSFCEMGIREGISLGSGIHKQVSFALKYPKKGMQSAKVSRIESQ